MRISTKTIVGLAGFDTDKVKSAFISGVKFNDLDTVANAVPGSELKVRSVGEDGVAKIPETLNADQEKCLEVANAKRAKAIEAKNEITKPAPKKEVEKK